MSSTIKDFGQLEALLRKDEELTAENLYRKFNGNQYILRLVEMVKNNSYTLRDAIRYGLSNIPEKVTDSAPIELASFFYILSEMKNIPDVVRDFAMDAMVWCEGAYDYSMYYKKMDLRETFKKKIEPLLT